MLNKVNGTSGAVHEYRNPLRWNRCWMRLIQQALKTIQIPFYNLFLMCLLFSKCLWLVYQPACESSGANKCLRNQVLFVLAKVDITCNSSMVLALSVCLGLF